MNIRITPRALSIISTLTVIGILTHPAPGHAQSVLTGVSPNVTLRDVISVKDYDTAAGLPGAVGNGIADDTAAIQAAIDRCSNGGMVLFPRGSYRITSPLLVDRNEVNLVGQGAAASYLRYEPTAPGPAILISRMGDPTPVEITGCSVRDMGIYAPAASANLTAGIRLEAASCCMIKNVRIWGGGGSSAHSFSSGSSSAPAIGLQICGKEDCTFTNIRSEADIPLSIETNPLISMHNGHSMHIDADHFHFQDLYLTANGAWACVNFGDPVSLTQVTFDGHQAWVGGKYGLFWNNANADYANGLVIMNVRTEQGADSSGYSIWIHNTSAHQQQHVVVTGLNGDPGRNGIHLYRTWWTNIQNFCYGGSGVALDAGSSNKRLLVHNSFFQIGSSLGTGTVLSPAPYSDGWVNTNP